MGEKQMELNKLLLLENLLKKAWCKETCYIPIQEKWSSNNPALGQCAVTALVVQDYFGGQICYCEHFHHYWNRFDGKEIDFTRSQFPEDAKICFDSLRSREYLLESESAKKVRTKERYLLLRLLVENEERKHFLEYARNLAEKSSCKRKHFGAVIVKNLEILAEGYNHPYNNQECRKCLRSGIEPGTKLELCRAVHAEQAALLHALNNQIDISGAVMYVAGTFPDGRPLIKKDKIFYCTFCARLLSQTNLKGIVIPTAEGPAFMNLEEVVESAFDTVTKNKKIVFE